MSARILIIEDNLTNLELMTYLLNAFGHTVLAADDGQRGVEAAIRERPELIICDIQLPDIDGFEVARRLHSDPSVCSIPMVAVTALAMVGDRDRVLSAGFDGYVAKPIDPETFLQQMEAFLPLEKHSTAPLAPIGPTVPGPQAMPPGYTILVVDQLPLTLDLARSILVRSGYKVLTAAGIGEGMALARKSPCDLILSDVRVSEGSGYEFLEAVRADPKLGAIPFVLITSRMIDHLEIARGLSMGAARYLCRPIEPDAFLAEIKACLGGKGKN